MPALAAASEPRGEEEGHPSPATGRAGRALRGTLFPGQGGRVGKAQGHRRYLGAKQGSRRRRELEATGVRRGGRQMEGCLVVMWTEY